MVSLRLIEYHHTNKENNNLLPLDDLDLENFRAFAFALSDLPSLHPVSKG